ncbi:aromatic prenyltransferase [Bimuria novae-zelandiae CBS 107.79]|uniref:Aromatic prenyltransferase n=1 Tax=Bimuria novae-zelandiae CBS 107.79 TaxID=1447943 RepID=A0A6A5VEQ8_9PLEO|nr:aromatic prenyltransferase [Bimuria novae-zelandiae CBS 107.79]
MTDDYSPLELSWDWGIAEGESSVGFSIEPIGKYADTPADPLNQKMVFQLVDGLRLAFHHTLDLTVFDVFSEALTTSREKLDTRKISVEGRSQYFDAFDLDAGHPRLKAYFMPRLKAVEANAPISELAVKAMDPCEVHFGPLFMQAFRRFNSDLVTFSTTSSDRPEIEIVGIYCVIPVKSRVKIYIRHRETSFDSCIFPVRHYASNDLSIAQGLATYFERRGQTVAAENYVEALLDIFSHRSLGSGLGLHTYISCTLKKTELAVTSYFNPEIYHPNRYKQ